jgi:hypothetical protein
MNINFIEYDFSTDTVSYPSNYNPTKLNLGYLMTKNTDSDGNVYVSPVEPIFLRGYEVVGNPPFSYFAGSFIVSMNSMGFFKYNSDVSWVFYTNGDTYGSSGKRIFLATYTKSTNQLTMIGSIFNFFTQASNEAYGLTVSMEYHTGGTVSVSSTIVTGVGTTWLTDGVCVGNRIGFGSSSSSGITIWYRVTTIVNNTTLTISCEYENDGITNNLTFPIGTPYVIEDLRLIFANLGASATNRGLFLYKGLRYENFTISPTTLPLATTVDNLRAVYRILDVTGTTATFTPIGIILKDKTSFTQQDLFTLSYPSTTTSSIQKFNIRAPLTFLTGGRSNSPYLFTTGAQAHNGTNVSGWNPFIKGLNDHYYITTFTRIARVIPANIISGSTTFITDSMVELPPGSATTFSLSSSLVSSHYLPLVQRFYIPNTTANRNYVTPYISGSTTPFERVVLTNDQVQTNTYTVSSITTPTSNYVGSPIRSYYHDGLSYIIRDVQSNNNVIYTLPIEADKQYHTTTNAYIVTPELFTPSATSYNEVYINAKTYFNDDNRFIVPRENYDIYYRTTGITTDIGSWTLINQNGSMSGVTGTSVQFKIAFSTIGHTCIPSLIYGISMSYNSDAPPLSIPFYEPSLKFTDKTSQIFTWRQNSLFSVEAPAVMIDIYDSSNNLLLSDDVSVQSGGTFEYSSDDGVTWNNWTYSANSVGNYLRYSSSTLSASGLIVKPIIFPSTPTPTPTNTVTPTPTPTLTPTPTISVTPTIDSDATAFISAAGITGTTEQSAINQLVIDLKFYNLWSKLRAIYPMVGGTANSHKFNLKNPVDSDAAFRLNFVGPWVHSSTGSKPNGTSTYADTFYIPNNYPLTQHLSYYSRTQLTTPLGTEIGAYRTITVRVNTLNICQNYTAGFSSSPTFTTTTDGRGFWLGTRRGNSDREVYRNGSSEGVNTVTETLDLPFFSLYLGAFQTGSGGGLIAGYSAKECAFASMGDSLTSSDVNLYYLAVQTYQTRLGRQV